ncbi:hypothetical protein L9F63_016562, partial [Diploptera punctata]
TKILCISKQFCLGILNCIYLQYLTTTISRFAITSSGLLTNELFIVRQSKVFHPFYFSDPISYYLRKNFLLLYLLHSYFYLETVFSLEFLFRLLCRSEGLLGHIRRWVLFWTTSMVLANETRLGQKGNKSAVPFLLPLYDSLQFTKTLRLS